MYKEIHANTSLNVIGMPDDDSIIAVIPHSKLRRLVSSNAKLAIIIHIMHETISWGRGANRFIEVLCMGRVSQTKVLLLIEYSQEGMLNIIN